MTTIKITELTNIGANLATSTVIPVVNMAGTPTTEKTVLGNIANVVLAGAGGNYVAAAKATTANTVTINAQPNITSTGSLTGLTVSNANGVVNFTTTANVTLGAVGNLHIAGGTTDQVLTTDGAGNLSWATVSGGGLSGIIVQDEGTNVVASANTINFVGNGVTASNVGNVATVTISGNSNQISNGNSNVSVPTSNDNVYITTNNGTSKQWIFNKDGSLRTPGNIDIYGAINFPQQVSNINWSTYNIELSQYGRITTNVDFFANANIIGAQYLKGDGSNITNISTPRIANGTSNVNIPISNSNVIISANGTANWTLDTTGNLSLPAGGSIYSEGFTPSGNPGNTITLNPHGSGSITNQKLLVYPTAGDGDHIHLTSGNLYQTELFLGSDNLFVKLANTGNVVINSNDGNSSNAMWTFSNDGTTTFPTGNITSNTSLQFTTTFANVKTVEYQTAGVWDLYVEDVATGPNDAWSWINVTFKDNQISKPQVFIENQKASDGIALRWTFDENGILVFPRDVAGNTDPYLTIVGGANPTILSSDASLAGPANLDMSVDYLNLSGSTGNRIAIYADNGEIGTEANMVLYTNLADPGNIVSWTLDTTGNLTLPDTTTITAGAEINLVANSSSNISGLTVNGDADANLYAHGNVTIVSDSSNTTATWNFGTDGNLTIPGGGAVWTLGTGTSGLTANFADPYKVNLGLDYTTNTATLAGANSVVIQSNTGANTNQWTFSADGTTTFPGDLIGNGASPAPSINNFNSISSLTLSASGNITGGNIIGNGNTLSNVATKTTGNWTLASGVNTVSISVPGSGTYSIWVNGNIPNGIVTYTATAVVTNTNVPVLGSQYAWYYAVGNALVFTSIPGQFVGTVGSISNVNTYAGNTANVFTFGITNNSGNTAVVNYGYTKL